MTLAQENEALKQSTDELAEEMRDWKRELRIATGFGIKPPAPPIGELRENGLLAVCAWCHPGVSGANVTHTVCARHFAEVAAGMKEGAQ